jgi:hypothetical protein
MSFSRRQILKATAGAMAFSLLGSTPLFAFPAQASLFSGRRLITGMGPIVAIIDLETMKIEHIPLGFTPHSFVQNPRDSERIWAIEMKLWGDTSSIPKKKSSPSLAEMDLRKTKVAQSLPLPEGEGFSGHGFFSADASTLFIPRTNVRQYTNYLTGYDAADCRKTVVNCRLASGWMHDSRLQPDGTSMLAITGKPPPNTPPSPRFGENNGLIQLDPHTGKSIRAWSIEDEQQEAGHFAALEDGTLIVISNGEPTTPGKVFIGRRDDASLKEVPYTERIKPGKSGELLSLAINKAQRIAVVTDPVDSRLLIIDLETRTFVKEIEHRCFGVAFDEIGAEFIGTGDGICILDAMGNNVENLEGKRFKNLRDNFNVSHSLLI